ncbi:hypothetical protein ASF83_02510 [Plantibacter sp. Leaf171]|jgi:hypothetical protein|uniref:hypothetical protein n=1 Tax=unclassified Plantibacter TaxID=2624265 RepID=UPI0007000DD0|nr:MULTISPECIES: hypothetical protein [unclassified Plantibacter]KQM14920.1 hypothetical protein ASE44_02525 [Plantibacter sp. Leaf1]KQR58063.1 hypothetical protein ASF83_02510 [Plantibacter sp. Leaf171]
MGEDERRRRAAEQEARALRALEAIRNGGDLSKETLDLSNEYSDSLGTRVAAWFRGARRRKD